MVTIICQPLTISFHFIFAWEIIFLHHVLLLSNVFPGFNVRF